MKDLWVLIIGDMPVLYQWAGVIVGLVLALLLLVVGGFGIMAPHPVKHGFTEDIFSLPGARTLASVDRHVGTAVNIVFWLVAGPLIGYLAAVTIYLTWPWCVVIAVVIMGAAKLIELGWHRHTARR